LKHFVFFVRARAISEKELLAQVQRLSFHCRGLKPASYRCQEFIPGEKFRRAMMLRAAMAVLYVNHV
jgi:hypothetical protein